MSKKIQRNYLEINSLADLKDSKISPAGYLVQLVEPVDFQLNKFFYKNVGKKHNLSIAFLSKLIDLPSYDFFQRSYKKIYLIENQLDLGAE